MQHFIKSFNYINKSYFLSSSLRFYCSNNENKEISDILYSRKDIIEDDISLWKIKAMASTFQVSLDKIIDNETKKYILPFGWHQLFCLPTEDINLLSDDGYESKFAPPKPYIARMWGGSKIIWNKDKIKLKEGDRIRKTSFIDKISFKEGKKSGKLLILNLVNQYIRVQDSKEILCDNISMIYRTQPFALPKTLNNNIIHAQALHKSFNSNLIVCTPSFYPTKWSRTIQASSVLLFRYSALTFNSHMIHYDINYANSEGFGNTLVHGPLQAQLLLDHVQQIFPNNYIQSFEYKALAPLENNCSFQLIAEKIHDTSINVYILYKDTITMKGNILFYK